MQAAAQEVAAAASDGAVYFRVRRLSAALDADASGEVLRFLVQELRGGGAASVGILRAIGKALAPQSEEARREVLVAALAVPEAAVREAAVCALDDLAQPVVPR